MRFYMLSQGCCHLRCLRYTITAAGNPRKISHVIIKIEINNKIAIPCGQGGNPILQGSALKCNFFICFSVIEIFFKYFLFSLFLTLLRFPIPSVDEWKKNVILILFQGFWGITLLQEKRRTDVLVARSASILLPEAERKLRRRVLITISASPATVGIFFFFLRSINVNAKLLGRRASLKETVIVSLSHELAIVHRAR